MAKSRDLREENERLREALAKAMSGNFVDSVREEIQQYDEDPDAELAKSVQEVMDEDELDEYYDYDDEDSKDATAPLPQRIVNKLARKPEAKPEKKPDRKPEAKPTPKPDRPRTDQRQRPVEARPKPDNQAQKPKSEPRQAPKSEPRQAPKSTQAVVKGSEAGQAKPKPTPPKPRVAPESVPTPVPVQAPAGQAISHQDGPGKAYKFLTQKRGWLYSPDYWLARQFGGDTVETVWVWYKDGSIDHLLTLEEADKFLL